MSATPNARVVAAMLAAAGVLAACGGPGANQPSGAVPTSTVPVVRTDIVSTLQLNGTLTYAGSYTLINQAPGVYTSLPSPGTVISRGQVLYRVDNRPVVLLYGEPEWRSLSVGAADGADVRQLETNLLALGFGTSANLVANGHFDSFDAAAVRRWQAAMGVAQTGTVGLADAIFEPGPIRVSSLQAGAGMDAGPGQPVIEATSTQRAVLVALDVTQAGLIKTGDAVTIDVPDVATPVAGTVSSVGSVATSSTGGGQPGPITVAVTITPVDPGAGRDFDQAPVVVGVTDAVHKAVLAVPVMALLAQPGGAYAVVVVVGSQRRAVTVTTGLFDDRGLVEVSGADLREGMLVEVPQS